VTNPTCNICDISLRLYPLLQSSCTLSVSIVPVGAILDAIVPFSVAVFNGAFHA
jgi:hypothetical protein